MSLQDREEIDRVVRQLSLPDLEWLYERLIQYIHEKRGSPSFQDEMEMMARDPNIQREIKQIEEEFRPTENDGLTDV